MNQVEKAGEIEGNTGLKVFMLIVLVALGLFAIPVMLILFTDSQGSIPDLDSWHGFISWRYYGQHQDKLEYAIYILSVFALIVSEYLIYRSGNKQLRRIHTLPLILFLFMLGFMSPYMGYLGVGLCRSVHPMYDAAVKHCNSAEYKDTEYAEWFCKIYCEKDPLAGLDQTKSIRMLSLLARAGHVRSQSMLGSLYLNGQRGMNKDLGKAEYWLAKAALKNDRNAQINLGAYYELGAPYGLVPDPDKALTWFVAAANNGHPAAMSILFRTLSSENTSKQKRTMAKYWLDKLDSIGEPRAKMWMEDKKLK